MTDIQDKIAELQKRGWTIAALADELEVSRDAVDKWMAGNRHPTNAKGIITILNQLARRRRVPKKRRYAKGSRKTTTFNQQ
jgi:transcriptional regulator with XRE-family HTH domain